MVEKNKTQRFWYFNGADFFEFFRRSLSLLSPSVMVVLILSLAAFFIEDEYGTDSLKYQIITYSIFIFMGFVIIALLYDLNRNFKGVDFNYLAKLFIFLATLILSIGIFYIGVINAANIYTLITAE